MTGLGVSARTFRGVDKNLEADSSARKIRLPIVVLVCDPQSMR